MQQSLQLSGISTKFSFKMSLNQNQNDYNGKPESGMEQLQVEKGKLWEMRIKRKWTNLNWVDFFYWRVQLTHPRVLLFKHHLCHFK